MCLRSYFALHRSAPSLTLDYEGFFRNLFILKTCYKETQARKIFWQLYDYVLPSKLLLNFVTDLFISLFWNSCPKNFRKYIEKLVEFHYYKNERLQYITYNWSKNSNTDTFLEMLREKNYYQILKIPKKPLENCPLLSNKFNKK